MQRDRLTLRMASRTTVEELERRTLLTALLSSAIPAQIDPATAPQALFSPGISTYSLHSQSGFQTVSATLYRFTVNNTLPGAMTTFTTSSTVPTLVDTALALFDADGNLIQSADSDSPSPSHELMTASLASEKPYILGVYTANLGPPFPTPPQRPVLLTVDTEPQQLSTAIRIDPALGSAEFLANSGQDTFNSPTDVNYFPLDLTNVGQSAAVTLNAVGLDVRFFAALFRQDTPGGTWQQIASGSGAPLTLSAAPPAGGDITDSRYLLATSPLNFNTAAQPYKIDLSSSALLGPAAATGQTVNSVGTAVPVSPGLADISTNQFFGGPDFLRIEALSSGPLTVSLTTNTSSPVVSAYDGSGSSLLAVSSATAPGTVTLTLNATAAGQSFILRMGDDHNAYSGQFTLDVKESYTPTLIAVGQTVGQQTGLQLGGANGAQVFRLTPPPGADYLVLQLAPNAGSSGLSALIGAVASGVPPVQTFAPAGQAAFLPIDLTKISGPVDVYVGAFVGSGTATLSYAAASIPRTIPINQFPTQLIDLKTGGISSTVAAPAFGQISGVQFYELSPGGPQVPQAIGGGGAQPLLLRYVQDNGALRLADRALPSTGSASLSSSLSGTLIYGLAAVNIGLNPGGTLQLSVTGAAPQGVGVGMAPNKVPQPNQPPPSGPFQSMLRVRNEVITEPQQRDLFSTLLPFDMTASPTLTFTPLTQGGPLAVKITVLDAANNVLYTFNTVPGQTFNSPSLSSITPASSSGKAVRLLIEPLPNQPLGDGGYNIELDVATADPNPYLAIETTLPPNFAIPFAFGGTFDGNFTSSQPTVQMYSFVVPNATSFQVSTTDLDPAVNTDIKLYRAHWLTVFPPNTPPISIIDRYDELPTEPPPSFDYYPADRSTVDARVVVNNYHILDGAFVSPYISFYGQGFNTIYIAVKNEQGTQGHYRVGAAAVPTTLVGPGSPQPVSSFTGGVKTLVIDPRSGNGDAGFTSSNGAIQFSTPSNLSDQPTLTVQSPNTGDTVTADVYDSSQNYLYSVSAPTNGLASLPLSLIARSRGYFVNVHFAIAGYANDVSLSAPVTVNSTNQPPSADELTVAPSLVTPVEPFTRATEAPDGSFTLDDSYNLYITNGTQEKIVFWVPASGLGHFSAILGGLNNPSFALYRGFETGGVEFQHFAGQLVDFRSGSTSANFSFDDYVTPGMYYLRLLGAVPGGGDPLPGSAIVSFQLPGYDAKHITLDPNSAVNDTDPLRTIDSGSSYFETSFYQVDVPGGVQSDLAAAVNGTANTLGAQGIVTIWKRSGTSFVQVGSQDLLDYRNSSNPKSRAVSHSGDSPTPGDQYFIGIHRDRLAGELLVGPSFTIPQSGDPDLLVDPIRLSSDNGRTRVTVTIRNQGYAVAPASHALLTFSNYPTPSVLSLAAIGPFGTITYSTDWNPDARPRRERHSRHALRELLDHQCRRAVGRG